MNFLLTPQPPGGPPIVERLPNNETTNLFCSGHTIDTNGNVFVTGGETGLTTAGYGSRDTNVFFWNSHEWRYPVPGLMMFPRWYPTPLRLADGRIFVGFGQVKPPDPSGPAVMAYIPEVWDGFGWTSLGETARLAHDPQPLYPYMFLIPSGEVFYAGTEPQTYALNVQTRTWRQLGSPTNPAAGLRQGSAAIYVLKDGSTERVFVMKCGGSDPAIAHTAVIELTAANPQWRVVADMSSPRRNHNLVWLPDGTLLTVGGNLRDEREDPVMSPELFFPATETWSLLFLPPMTVPRGYHSVALLLRDGRVLVAGGDLQPTCEIYSPGYLSATAGPRPNITNAPTEIQYGVPFDVQGTQFTATGMKACLIGLASTTHGFDTNQRYIQLTATANGPGVLRITPPSGATIAPPGWYMLFVTRNNNGKAVPCKLAAYVHVL